MKTVPKNFRWAAVLLGLLLLVSPLPARDHEGEFERTVSVGAAPEIEVTAESGNIDVRAGADATVRVRGHIKVNRAVSAQDAERIIRKLVSQPPIEQDGNRVRVGRIKDWSLGGFVSISFDRHPFSISYELTVPADTRLKSDTGSGDQSLMGLKGPVKASTGSGNMRLANLSNETRADTGSGDIEINSVAGPVFATTGSGNIRASAVAGSIRAHTGSGDVAIEQSGQGLADVETGSGSVEIRGAGGPLRAETGSGNLAVSGTPGGDWKLETGSGNVTLRLSPQSAITLNAHTGSGSIESDHPITVQGKVGRTELRGTLRGGGSRVDVGTGSGDIRIE